jgi:hypothetical protein
MPSRLVRNTALLFKTESTYGIDPTPTGAANAMLVGSIRYNPFNAQLIDRSVIRQYMGANEKLVGAKYIDFDFDTDLAGPDTTGGAVPAWAAPLLCCGCAGVATAATRYDITPVSSGHASGAAYWYDDGIRHKAFGIRGNATISAKINEKPKLGFKMTALYAETPAPVVIPSQTLTAFKPPLAVAMANGSTFGVGGTLNASGAPAITAAAGIPSLGIELDIGNQVAFVPMTGQETVEIGQRDVTAKVTLDVDPSMEAALYAQAEAGITNSTSFSHGTTAQKRWLLFMARSQIVNIAKAEGPNGKRLLDVSYSCLPTNGNDEFQLVTSF